MKKETWKELPIGTVNIEAANSVSNRTGTWRSGRKPEFIEDRCIQCLFCWLYCPHFAIVVKEGKMVGINYDYCTGCGLCSEECPTKEKSIIMVKEEITLAAGRKS
jgi:pyruvate ferredoxin oxidoreductase delta subunit